MLVPPPPLRRRPRSHDESHSREYAVPVVPVVRIKVTLLEVVPPVWRRFQVPANLTLRRLHAVLQTVMGWNPSPSHLFRAGDELFGMPSGDAEAVKDSRWTMLQHLLSRGTKSFSYEYQLGDFWAHMVRIEGVSEGNPANQIPICLAGENPCPPAGCGGPDGYARAADAERGLDSFDLAAVNEALAALDV